MNAQRTMLVQTALALTLISGCSSAEPSAGGLTPTTSTHSPSTGAASVAASAGSQSAESTAPSMSSVVPPVETSVPVDDSTLVNRSATAAPLDGACARLSPDQADSVISGAVLADQGITKCVYALPGSPISTIVLILSEAQDSSADQSNYRNNFATVKAQLTDLPEVGADAFLAVVSDQAGLAYEVSFSAPGLRVTLGALQPNGAPAVNQAALTDVAASIANELG